MRRYLAVAMVGAIAIVIALTIRLDDDQAALPAPASTTAPPTTTTQACGEVRTTDDAGQPLNEFFLTEVRAVHVAACRGDHNALLALTTEGFNPPPDAFARLLRQDPTTLTDLAQVLQSTPLTGQGGLVYCVPGKGRTAFARDVLDHPGGWSLYEPKVTHC